MILFPKQLISWIILY